MLGTRHYGSIPLILKGRTLVATGGGRNGGGRLLVGAEELLEADLEALEIIVAREGGAWQVVRKDAP